MHVGVALLCRNEQENIVGMPKEYPLVSAYWDNKRAQLNKVIVSMYVLVSSSSMFHTEGFIGGFLYVNSKEKW